MIQTIKTVKYAFYILFHPNDGFWELKNHMPKTLGAANLILALLCFMNVLSIQFTSFHYGILDRDSNNIIFNVSSFVVPLAAWTILNWALSTLLDGKATMKQIWVQSIYSLVPVLLSMPVLMICSYIMTHEEATFYYLISSIAVIWSVFLFLVGNMTIQDYTMRKTILMALFTIAGIAASIFIGIILFSTFQQLISFITTVITEIRFMP
ncbi:MAG: YIP1 family protein [Oscillospiraceae bacterium]|nr:YIP1 family protein [Oscillospiraceae bacterium]